MQGMRITQGRRLISIRWNASKAAATKDSDHINQATASAFSLLRACEKLIWPAARVPVHAYSRTIFWGESTKPLLFQAQPSWKTERRHTAVITGKTVLSWVL